jgi:hypothetical protein
MAVCVTADEHASTVFGVGSTIMVDIAPTTPVTLLNGTSTAQQLRPQMLIKIHYSLSNRKRRVMFIVHDISELPLVARADSSTRRAPQRLSLLA